MFAEAELGAGSLERTRPVVELQRVFERLSRGVLVLSDHCSATARGGNRPGNPRRFCAAFESRRDGLSVVRPPQPHICLDEIGMSSKVVRIPDSTILERADTCRQLLRRAQGVTRQER